MLTGAIAGAVIGGILTVLLVVTIILAILTLRSVSVFLHLLYRVYCCSEQSGWESC